MKGSDASQDKTKDATEVLKVGDRSRP